MKEVQPEKGLKDRNINNDYTEAEFDQALSDNDDRQSEVRGLTAYDARQIDSITLMRIYDLLGALLTHFDEETATAILEAHAEGRLIGPFPSLNI